MLHWIQDHQAVIAAVAYSALCEISANNPNWKWNSVIQALKVLLNPKEKGEGS